MKVVAGFLLQAVLLPHALPRLHVHQALQAEHDERRIHLRPHEQMLKPGVRGIARVNVFSTSITVGPAEDGRGAGIR